MSTFTTTGLSGHRVLVTGEDAFGTRRTCVLNSTEYDALNLEAKQKELAGEFDSAVEAFFAPLTEAAEKIETMMKTVEDPAFFVVVQEEVPGTEAKREILHHMDKDTVILRFLASGDTSRLIWVEDTIEILALPSSGPATQEFDISEAVDLNDLNQSED
jgi:hypothetical protein